MSLKKCKCKSEKYVVMGKAQHKGLYCASCGKWLQWLNKDERNLAVIMGIKTVNVGSGDKNV